MLKKQDQENTKYLAKEKKHTQEHIEHLYREKKQHREYTEDVAVLGREIKELKTYWLESDQ